MSRASLASVLRQKPASRKGSFVCELCKSVLHTKASYTEHKRRHFKRYECCECGKRYTILGSALCHYIEQHGGDANAFACQQCGFTTASLRKFRYHREKHKEKPQCTQCGKTFVNKSGLKTHMFLIHTVTKRTYTCRYEGCERTFCAKSGLKRHELLHGREYTAFCTQCRKHFKCETTLKTHLKFHSSHVNKSERKFACKDCDQKFLSKYHLQEHIDWVHLKKTTHQCQQCSKVFVNARALLRHKQFVHEKIRRPRDKICDYCGKGFTTLPMLSTHIRTHTGERPLSCARCAATFAHPGALYTHNKLLHNNTSKQQQQDS